MAHDRLSEMLDLVEVRSVMSGGAIGRGAWRTHGAIVDDLKFIAVVRGRARLTTNGVDEAIELAEGDVALLNGRAWLTLEGRGDGQPMEMVPVTAQAMDLDAADADTIIGGCIVLNPVGREVLLQALPPVAHVAATGAAGSRVHEHARQLFAEIVAAREGSSFAIKHFGQLLILETLRGFMHDADLPAGWLKALSDERLRPALALIHQQPAKSWSLEDLARASAMSRTTFAQRFRDVAGTSPLTYLIGWRMLLAQRALRSGDTRVGTLAFELGYSSESAFSSAFERHVGESPLTYRKRVALP